MIEAALAIGAPLYLPGTRPDLTAITLGRRIPGLRSAIICLEDSVRADVAETAFVQLGDVLSALDRAAPSDRPALFVRPRDAAMLARLVNLPGIARVSGFVLPKVTAATLPAYLAVRLGDHHRLMPTIETREAGDARELRRLRTLLIGEAHRILAIRIGGNDLLQAMGARRSRVRTIYEGPVGPLIASLVGAFAPWGFALSAPVFEAIEDPRLLADEVGRDIEHGLLPKAAVHPSQVAVIEAGQAVDADELGEARTILADTAPGVFASRGGMCEPATHRRWAEWIVARAAAYGMRREPGFVRAV